MIIVSDTSPLVCLLHLNQINLLKDLFVNVIIPTAVFNELIKAKIINEKFLQTNSFIQIKTPADKRKVEDLMLIFDEGEAEAIVLSIELKTDLLLIDEAPEREIAIQYGIPIKGILGVLLQAKERKLISQVNPLINRLQTEINFRINNKLLQKKILIEANEL
jgi:predicted nucleic acid-binding protein